ncbi:FxsA family membrane protein [Streptomyces sp. NPDC005423]|uniref:FxsA family membrane protein n=1 Tax=Streptomyces sp. NPDC005423 TaxID=3155343 RepID=UPI0033A870EA
MTTGVPTTPSPSPPARPRRFRLRTALPLGLAVWAVLEIWLLIVVAGATSGLTVLLLLVAGLVAGALVIKRAGRRAFRNLSRAVQQGATPAPAGGGGNGPMMLGGLLLVVPGLLSDAVGLLLLLPPVQKGLSRFLERTVERKLRQAVPGTFGDAFQQARMGRPDGKVVPGEVIREEPGDGSQGPRPPLAR